jgi:hypothetical protein
MDHRLSRRTLFSAAAVVLAGAATAGCDPASGAGAGQSPTTNPPDGTPVASWELTGGAATAGLLALRAPRLVVFADGETIADAAYRSRLASDELRGLLDHLVASLRMPGATKRRSGSPSIVDAPTTVFKVWTGHATLAASADGLDEQRDNGTYSSALYDARDRFGLVYKNVVATAQPYLADRVRVVTQDAPAATTAEPTPWPAELVVPTGSAVPTAGTGSGVRRADLDGQAARSAVRLLTRDLDQRGAWPTYRTGDGRLVQASWRYLLPNE